MAPAYLSDHINFVNHGKSLRSKDPGVLYVPRINTGDRAFSICGPRIWNKLPIHIQKAPTLEAFKKKLKTITMEKRSGPITMFKFYLLFL